MKNKIIAVAIAMAAMTLASCTKEKGQTAPTDQKARVSLQISGLADASHSRAVQAPGSDAEGTIQLTNGHIFVVEPNGSISHSEALDVVKAKAGTAQVLSQDVASDSRIYVVGNIPTANTTLRALTSIEDILDEVDAISTQADYKGAALANSDGQPKLITVTASSEKEQNLTTIEATVTVLIKPLISRVELGKITGNKDIISYTVAGVYVDEWASQFTYGGSYDGTVWAQAQNTTFATGFLGDETGWASNVTTPATAEATPAVAAPGSGNVWAYNVPAGNLPRLIIKLTGVTYVKDDLSTTEVVETYAEPQPLFLTVTGYKEGATAITKFVRGNIYSIGGGVDGNGIVFGPEDTSFTPNPANVTLAVTVDIEEWAIVPVTANI